MTCVTRHHSRLLTMLLAALIATTLFAGPAAAQDAPDEAEVPRLGIAPLDYDGAWFDLEMDAGERRNLSVELANHGGQPTDAHTYAADVYTLVGGGGMGIGLRDDAVGASTQWLDYPTQTLSLQPDQGRRRSVTVAVPTDAAPGQYIAALVIENDQPMSADGELSVERVMRQALAINITVPGPAAPALELGEARHTGPGGRSVVLLGVDNPGNRHLSPAGQLTLTDASGDTVATHELEMDIHFAGTATDVELSLDELLAPGIYTIAADLRDSEHDVAATGTASFEVVAPPVADRVGPGVDRVRDSIAATGLPVWMFLTAVGLILALLLALILVAAGRRRPGHRADTTAEPLTPTPPTAAPADPSPSVAAPPTAAPTLGMRERRSTRRTSTRRTSPRPAVPAPSQVPTRAAPQPVPAGAQTATVQAVKDPQSAVLFTARPPSRRRRGSR